MNIISVSLTVYFDNPFWVGVFEKIEDGNLSVAKIVFRSEPKDSELYEFIIFNYNGLRFSKTLAVDKVNIRKINPKRMQRQIKRVVKEKGIGTKAQQAIKLEQESRKIEKKKKRKLKREFEKEEKFRFKQDKKKKKKRGH